MDIKSIRGKENMHIVMWLLKDSCWVMDWKIAGIIMIIPTLSLAVYITWKMRHNKSELFHNLAVCNWITANSIWMAGEFFYNDTLRPPATIFFALGVLSVIYYYFIHTPFYRKKLNED
ncbi:MAG TPA: hypothetical protein VJY62_21160 [Bacteroidia bacterium]|nr:hypothetical protein [Bacteroidia bacterium]